MKRTKQTITTLCLSRQVVEEALEADSKRSEIAHRYGLKPRLPYRWIAEYQKGISWAKGAEQKNADAKCKALYKEIHRPPASHPFKERSYQTMIEMGTGKARVAKSEIMRC